MKNEGGIEVIKVSAGQSSEFDSQHNKFICKYVCVHTYTHI